MASARASGSKKPTNVVKEAIVALNEPFGSSLEAIERYIEGRYRMPRDFKQKLQKYMMELVRLGYFVFNSRSCYELPHHRKKPKPKLMKRKPEAITRQQAKDAMKRQNELALALDRMQL